jgi:O-antigen/teichoic acid export membrane protein
MVLLSLRRYRMLVLISLSSLLLGIVLVLALTSADGARGAAWGTAITEIGGAIVVPLLLLRTDPRVVPSMGAVPRVALAAAPAALVALIPGLPAIVAVVLATLIYLAMLLALRVVPVELFDELRRLRARYPLRGRLA